MVRAVDDIGENPLLLSLITASMVDKGDDWLLVPPDTTKFLRVNAGAVLRNIWLQTFCRIRI
jgi:hypothetical protein